MQKGWEDVYRNCGQGRGERDKAQQKQTKNKIKMSEKITFKRKTIIFFKKSHNIWHFIDFNVGINFFSRIDY